MTATQLIAVLAVGSALLAVWCYVRWPGAAPNTLRRALLLGLLGLGCLQLGLVALEGAAGASERIAVLAVVAVVVPVLTFAFLASLWILRLFAAALKGLG